MLKVFKYAAVKIVVLITVLAACLATVIAIDRHREDKEKAQAYNIAQITTKQIDNVVDDKAQKLMIVAHPDDEVLWGGGHLMSGDYLVVCVTNGRNKKRSEEFANVMKASGNEFIMLDYPDKVCGRRDLWKDIRKNISADLEKIMKYKKWEQIVVHNQAGEYGHIHHQNVHAITTEIYDRNHMTEPLYFFGQYFKKRDIDKVKNQLVPITEEQYQFKKRLADLYGSQNKTVKKLWHMSRYEMWMPYKPYSEHYAMGKRFKDNKDKVYET